MKRHLKIFLAGALIVVPLALTTYIVWSIAGAFGAVGYRLIDAMGLAEHVGQEGKWLVAVMGVAIVLAGIYAIGVLTRWAIFRYLIEAIDRLLGRLPGVKLIYESIRDLMRLFGGKASQMGRVVLYQVPNTGIALMGILTNERPVGIYREDRHKVALYVPLGYQFAGLVLYVSPEHLEDCPLTVEQALKLAATAHVGAAASIQDLPQTRT